MHRLYWRFLALILRHPFVVPGHTLHYCWKCLGWGEDGYECPVCRGEGYRP